jgi:hypothetical protein
MIFELGRVIGSVRFTSSPSPAGSAVQLASEARFLPRVIAHLRSESRRGDSDRARQM